MPNSCDLRNLRKRNSRVILIAVILWGVLVYTQIARDRLLRPIDLFEDENTVFRIVVPPSETETTEQTPQEKTPSFPAFEEQETILERLSSTPSPEPNLPSGDPIREP